MAKEKEQVLNDQSEDEIDMITQSDELDTIIDEAILEATENH